MPLSRNSFNIPANSLLESVVALSIISVCLYIAVIVYSSVYTPKTTARSYFTEHKVSETFFLLQIGLDSLIEEYDEDGWNIEREFSDNTAKMVIGFKDSIQVYRDRTYYLPAE